MTRLVNLTEGYSCSDLSQLCKEAAMQPLREVGSGSIRTIREDQLRPINYDDFAKAVKTVRPSVSSASIEQFTKWLHDNGYS